jgi:hypothetical protein
MPQQAVFWTVHEAAARTGCGGRLARHFLEVRSTVAVLTPESTCWSVRPSHPPPRRRYFDTDFLLETLARGIAMAAVLFLGLQLSHAVSSPQAAAAILEGAAQASALPGL